ncbi:MAG: hypothetical protein LPJ89_04985, partial [Hymenobacteraceae bacterium]|nr:hypothetical protein [Hymenobacteraceae bacterium]MDX5397022.1 hypothetical protein [Hymenobacteraceae bacterium]MDX5443121.1 hypothetical protein [Hymenobacteraceae bacterium]MDX5513096.1 hypothetical protein [Hymenobacteraceae bacterium]
KSTEIWSNISKMPYMQELQQELHLLDSLSARGSSLKGFLDKKVILTSLHVTGNTTSDFMFYIPVNTVEEHRYVRRLVENISKSEDFRIDTRNYQGFQITDVTNTLNENSFSFFSYHNNIVVSAAPVLVEQVIRRINKKNMESPAKDFDNINYLDQEDVFANVFINYRNLPQFLSLFFREEIRPEINALSSLCKNSMLEFKLHNNKIFLNGFSNPADREGSFYQLLQDQKPQPLEVRDYIPNRTALLLHFGIESMTTFRKNAPAAGAEEATGVAPAIIDSLARSYSRELALTYLEAYNINTSPEKVVFAYSQNPERTTRLIREIVSLNVAHLGESPQEERYSRYRIRLINLNELPMLLFGKTFKGFEQVYVAQVDKYTLFTADVTTMRTVLSDIDAQSVWGKSVAQQAFLEETQHEANLSIFVNTVNAWYLLSRYLTDEKVEAQLQNASLLKKFNLFSMQYSLTDKQYYTSILLKHQEEAPGRKKSDELVVSHTVKFSNLLTTRPFPVRNPVDKSSEVIVQDSSNVIHNIASNGKVTWTDSVAGPVAGTIHQIEVGQNKNLRYLFATTNKIYHLDRNGRDVENFPFNLSDSLRIQNLSVFDYDKNGDYKLVVDDYLGNIYMLDMQGNLLPGWQPLQLDYRLAAPPKHYKVNGKDVILVILENGYIYALTTEGNAYPGFPFSLRAPVISGAFAKPGATFKKSEFTIVTQQGEVVVFNLLGEVMKREQLLRSGRHTIFELVPEANDKAFVIVRQDLGRVTLFNQDMEQVLEKSFVTSAPKLVQFYHYGGDSRIYAITEAGPQKTYLFDAKGQLIGNRKLDSSFPVSIFYNDVNNQYQLFKAHGKEVKKMTF